MLTYLTSYCDDKNWKNLIKQDKNLGILPWNPWKRVLNRCDLQLIFYVYLCTHTHTHTFIHTHTHTHTHKCADTFFMKLSHSQSEGWPRLLSVMFSSSFPGCLEGSKKSPRKEEQLYGCKLQTCLVHYPVSYGCLMPTSRTQVQHTRNGCKCLQ